MMKDFTKVSVDYQKQEYGAGFINKVMVLNQPKNEEKLLHNLLFWIYQ